MERLVTTSFFRRIDYANWLPPQKKVGGPLSWEVAGVSCEFDSAGSQNHTGRGRSSCVRASQQVSLHEISSIGSFATTLDAGGLLAQEVVDQHPDDNQEGEQHADVDSHPLLVVRILYHHHISSIPHGYPMRQEAELRG